MLFACSIPTGANLTSEQADGLCVDWILKNKARELQRAKLRVR